MLPFWQCPMLSLQNVFQSKLSNHSFNVFCPICCCNILFPSLKTTINWTFQITCRLLPLQDVIQSYLFTHSWNVFGPIWCDDILSFSLKTTLNWTFQNSCPLLPLQDVIQSASIVSFSSFQSVQQYQESAFDRPVDYGAPVFIPNCLSQALMMSSRHAICSLKCTKF